jgi:hypothetical protein
MTTTQNPATPLTVRADHLAVGDHIYIGSPRAITSVERPSDDIVRVQFEPGTYTAFSILTYVTVLTRRPIPALNDVVTALTELAETWERESVEGRDYIASRYLSVKQEARTAAGIDQLQSCAAEVRAILDRLA